VFEGLGQELAVARELPLDQPRGEDHAGHAEEDLVPLNRDLDLVRTLLGDQPAELAHRAGRHVRLQLRLDRLLELRVLDAEPVRVGGHHRERLLRCGDEDTGEDRTHLVPRRGARDAVDRLGERGSRHLHRLAVELGKAWELVGRQCAEVEGGARGGDLDVALLRTQREGHLASRERAHDVGEEAAREQDGALGLDVGVGGEDQAELDVGRAQLEAVAGRVQEDSAE
jgi:hypothetical protein